jgi:hypothetical protein
MSDLKTRLIQLLDLAQSFQRQWIADFPGDADRHSGTWEQWSLKDELAHVVAWQLNSLARIAAFIHAEPVPDFNDFERLNRAIFDTNRDRQLAEIVAEGDRAFAEYAEIVESFSEEELSRPMRESDREERSLAVQILNNGFEHPIVHYAGFYQRHGELAKGTQLYQTSVAAVADWPELYGAARYNLACFLAISGQTALAVAELREALLLRPDLIAWSKQDTDLNSLRGEPAYPALYQS